MSNPDRLYRLLPAVYRQRDLEYPQPPLKQLLEVIAEQVDVVEADIAQLYENWFIETCEDWVVPYIADLIGYEVVTAAGLPGDAATAQGQARNHVLFPRREIANTIRYRRQKGTLALLEQLAHDIASWPARAVEFYPLLGRSQHLNHLNLSRGSSADLRAEAALASLDGPFDQMAHTIDVRNITAHRDPGRYNIPNVGLFVWRLKPYSVTQTPAYCLEEVGPHCYTFSVLGNDTPLFTRPEPEPEPTHIAAPLNLPIPISRFAFTAAATQGTQIERASTDYYGAGRSLGIWADGWNGAAEDGLIASDRIIPANLENWQYRPLPNTVAVDPVLGRIVFPPSQMPRQGVRVYYHYGFSDDLGGGEYPRAVSQRPQALIYRVGRGEAFDSLNDALQAWRNALNTPTPAAEAGAAQPEAVIEITDSRVYTEPFRRIPLGEKQRLQIRAASRARPVIRLLDYLTDSPDSFNIEGEAGSAITLDGLLITGRGVRISGELSQVVLRHCTLVPGWAPDSDCEPRRPSEPSLELFDVRGQVWIDHCILGSIQVNQNEVQTDPVSLTLTDSILDATDATLEAIGAPGCPVAHVNFSVYRSTVIGLSQVHAMPLVENSLFMGLVTVARRQTGCVRFCYVPPGSKTPRRYRCQPDLVEAAATATTQATERQRVRPKFNSLRYGQPTYCQLAHLCAEEIKRGADDESEMGVFHNLFQPQRTTILQTRLDEFTPAEMAAGIIYAS